jgi:hypothetical protein
MALVFRSEGRALRAACAATDAGADGTRAERGSFIGVGIVPTDGTRLPIVRKRRIRYVAVFPAALTLAKFLIYAASITLTEQNCSPIKRNYGPKPSLFC